MAKPVDADPPAVGTSPEALGPFDALRVRLIGEIAHPGRSVTIVIPCFNYGQYVKEAVDSALNQTYPFCDVVLVDDGSTDAATVEACQSLVSDRLIVFRQANQGLSAARNNGAALTNSEFLMFLDADDRLHPDAVLFMLWSLLRHPDSAYVYCSQKFFGDENVVWEPQAFNGYDLLFANHPSVCSLIRRCAYDDAHGYSPGMVASLEDWCHWLMLLAAGHSGRCLRAPLFEHRRHGRTMTHYAQSRRRLSHPKLRQHSPSLYEIETLSALKARWRLAVSVVTPYYNNGEYIDETLAALQRQTTYDFEWIIVDDGSTDEAAIAKLEAIEADKDSYRFPIAVCWRSHQGAPAARNFGALQARGEYFLMLDSDDLIAPTALEKLVLFAELHPSRSYVYSCVRHFGEITGTACDRFDGERLKRENFLAISCLIRRDVFLAIGGFDEALLDSYEGYDLWLRLLAHGHEGVLLPEPLFSYRRRTTGYSAELARRKPHEEMIAILRARHPALFGGPERDRSGWKLIPPQGDVEESDVEALCTTLLADALGVRRASYRRRLTPDMFAPRHWRRETPNVLYFAPYFVCGGAERVDLDIIAGMKDRGFCVTTVGCENADNIWLPRFEALTDDIFILPDLAGDPTAQDAIVDYLMIARAVDIVFIRNSAVGYRLAERWRSVTSHVRFVDLLHLHAFGEYWVRFSALYHDLLDRRFVITDELKSYVCETYHLPPDKFEVIYNGLDFSMPPTPSDHERLKRQVSAEFGFDAGKPIIGFCGRFSEQKDPTRWLDVFAIAVRQNPCCHGLMIGDGELAEPARVHAAKLGITESVAFAGYRDDARRLIGGCDVLLLTSRNDGLPTVILEALAAGVPAVASDVGGTRECFGDPLSRLLPVSANDLEYAQALNEVLERLEQSPGLREDCRAHIRQRFDIGGMQEAYGSALSRLAARVDRKVRLDDYLDYLMERSPLG